MQTDVKQELENPDEESSFGIRKIIDCKIFSDGRQMYKVEWEATWEPAEALVTCQHLVDEFWSHVNKVKALEHVAMQCRRNAVSSSTRAVSHDVHADIKGLSGGFKTEINDLVERTSATPTGSSLLRTPHELLTSSERSFQEKKHPISDNEIKPEATKPPSSKGAAAGAADGLRYIANFTNPYVKLIVVCKVCNKEQSLKNASNWANHFLVHDKSLGHKCPYCPKTFARPNLVKKHIDSKHSSS